MARPALRDAALSPDGSCVAVLGDQRVGLVRNGLVLLSETANLSGEPVVVPLGDCEVERVAWASNSRLLVWVLLDKGRSGQEIGVRWKGTVLTEYTRRVWAMDRDGRNQVLLFNNLAAELKRNRDLGSVVDCVSDTEDCIVMKAWSTHAQQLALFKVNVRTGEAALMEAGGSNTYGWITQQGVPVLRLDASGETVSIFARAPGEKDWKFYRKFRRNETAKLDGIDFIGGTPEPGVLLVATTPDGEDKQSIHTFDLRTLQVGELVAARPDRDMSSCLVDRQQRLLGTSWWQDRLSYDFKDPDLAKHYRGVCVFFKNECNVAIVDISDDHGKFVVLASGPRHSGSYWLYDRKRAKLDPLGAVYSKLGKTPLASMEILSVNTRDGLSLTAYLTRPPGTVSKRPLVVMPHGGPETRDAFQYDPMLQAMASEGWLVLQVNFRGSSGYGRAFADAGRRHWGDKMQDDIEDALQIATATGEVDETRIAICGVSYGGYAALMSAVKTPQRYKAVVSIAGVGDLPDMLAYVGRTQGDLSLSYRYWVRTIGDPKTDRDALHRASPAERAEEIQAPVLLMHGELDPIVPAKQSRTMRDALKRARKTVDYVEAVAEGHPQWTFDNNIMMARRTLDHIRKAFA